MNETNVNERDNKNNNTNNNRIIINNNYNNYRTAGNWAVIGSMATERTRKNFFMNGCC